MTRTRGNQWRSLLGAILLVIVGLAACGGESASVAPPAPPPAPPPFQPQPVEVKSAGGTEVATLMTAEGGGYTLNGEAFAGGEVEAEGKTFTLALVEGNWVATFQPVSVEVALGDSRDEITLMTTEAGGWTRDGEEFSAGEFSTEDGRIYDFQESDGEWTATFQPQAVEVQLGDTDDEITLMSTEVGGWTLDGDDFEAGVLILEDGRTYDLQMDDGQWTATFQPDSVVVLLGDSGDDIVLMTTEDGGWTLDGEPFRAGRHTLNGRTYTIVRTQGMWRARFSAHTVRVPLGEFGGTVEVTEGEDGGWWIGDTPITNNYIYRASNGNRYRLVQDRRGNWTGAFVSIPESIAGTSVIAHTREDGSGFDLDGANGELDRNGRGEITVGRYSYRVSRDAEGTLGGDIFDTSAAFASKYSVPLGDDGIGLSQNGEVLVIDHQNDEDRADIRVALSDLIPDGEATTSGDSIIDEVRTSIVGLVNDFKSWVQLSSSANSSTYNAEKYAVWDDINELLADRLDIEDTDGGKDILPRLTLSSSRSERIEDEEDAIELLDDVVAALSSSRGLEAALSRGGVFEDNHAFGPENAYTLYAAEDALTQMTYGVHPTADLRFGAWRNRARPNAQSSLTDNVRGAYAWSADMTETYWIDLPTRGLAIFQGHTSAIDTEDSFVDATITMSANFEDSTVETVVQDLMDRTTSAVWHDGDGYVRLVKLPIAVISRDGISRRSSAIFEGKTDPQNNFGTETGGRFRSNYTTVEYQALSTPHQVTSNSDSTRDGEINGRFVGTDLTGSLSAGPLGAIGTFELFIDKANNTKGLIGGFGVSREGNLTLPDTGNSTRAAFEWDFGRVFGKFGENSVTWSVPFPLDADLVNGARPTTGDDSKANYYRVDPN